MNRLEYQESIAAFFCEEAVLIEKQPLGFIKNPVYQFLITAKILF